MVRRAGDADAGVVLLRAINVIWKLVVGDHVIELGGWLVVLRGPVLPAIGADGCAAVIGINEPLRIGWIDPQAVIVAMRR